MPEPTTQTTTAPNPIQTTARRAIVAGATHDGFTLTMNAPNGEGQPIIDGHRHGVVAFEEENPEDGEAHTIHIYEQNTVETGGGWAVQTGVKNLESNAQDDYFNATTVVSGVPFAIAMADAETKMKELTGEEDAEILE